MRKTVLIIGIVFASLLVFSTGALTVVNYEHTYSDPAGDVSPSSNSNIDITSVSSTESGANVVLTIVVAGTIDSATASYTINVIVDGVSGYYFTYSYGFASGSDPDYNTIPVDCDISASTLTFTVAKTDLGATTSFDINYAQTADSAYNMDWWSAGAGGDEEEEEAVDPSTETPTDTSISVTMSIDFDYSEGATTITFDWKMSGTTGGVDHCSYCTVTHYANGTKEVSGWTDGPIPETTWFGMTTKFVSTSDSNWQTWEFRCNGTVNKTEAGWKEGEKPTKMIVYVRAYSDSAEEHWNQASKEVTFDQLGPVVTDGGGEKKGFIPGFEVLAVLVALGISSLIFTKRKN